MSPFVTSSWASTHTSSRTLDPRLFARGWTPLMPGTDVDAEAVENRMRNQYVPLQNCTQKWSADRGSQKYERLWPTGG